MSQSGVLIPPPDIGGEAEVVASLQVGNLTPNRLVQSDGSKVLASVADLSDWVAGTANQITVTDDGDGTVTLSLAASLTLTDLTLSGLTPTHVLYAGAGGLVSGNAGMTYVAADTRLILTNPNTTNTSTDGTSQLRLAYNGTDYIDLRMTTLGGFDKTFWMIPSGTQDLTFCQWKLLGSDFSISYRGTTVTGSGVPNLMISGPPNSGSYTSASGPGLNLNNELAAVDGKCWGMNLNNLTLQFEAFNDANNAATRWLSVLRSGTSISSILFDQATTPIGIGSVTSDFNIQVAGTASATGVAGATFAAQNTIPATCTTRYSAFQINATTAAAAFTLSDMFGIYSGTPVKGAGSTITRITPFACRSTVEGVGSNSAGFYYGAVAPSYTGTWAFYNATATNNYLGDGSTSFGTTGILSWSTDLHLRRTAAGTISQSNGVNAQAYHLYETTDSDSAPANYARLSIRYDAAQGDFRITTQEAGTGNDRTLTIGSDTTSGFLNFRAGAANRWQINASGHLLTVADNTLDIGASGATRPRTVYAGTSIVSSGYAHIGTANELTSAGDFVAGTLNNSRIAFDESNNLFMLYNANTTSAANYERWELFASGGTFWINTQRGGTGSTRALNFAIDSTTGWQMSTSRHWVPGADASYNLGSASARVLGGYFSSLVAIGTNPAASGSLRVANGGSMVGRNAANSADLGMIEINGTDQVLVCSNGAALKIGTSGHSLGFYGATPVARPAAYTQTYATATRTHAALTSADIGAFTGGSVGFLDAAERDNVRTQYNALKADLTNLKQLVNQIIDDKQADGQFQ